MKKILLFYAFLLSLTLNAQTPSSIIIKLKNDFKKLSLKEVDSISKQFNSTSVRKLYTGKKSNVQLFEISFSKNEDIDAVIKKYIETGLIEYAEPNHPVYPGGRKVNTTPNDSQFYKQWSLNNNGSFNLSPSVAGADINMEAAWDIEQGDENVIVAVIDSGIYVGHEDFGERIWQNPLEIPSNGIDDDGNGFIDDKNGWDFHNNTKVIYDAFGHGTNVASIVGASGNNAIGFTGVDLNCKIMPLKVFEDENGGLIAAVVEAISYAVDNGAKVINLSLGSTTFDLSQFAAVQYAITNNVVVVACMMNTNNSTSYYPAGIEGVIAVGSTDSNDERSSPFFWSTTSGSNYGIHISVVAPGNYIFGLSNYPNDNYSSYWGGTSQAAPHVAGLAALLLAQDPSRTPAQIKSIIENTAEDQVGNTSEDAPGFDIYYGHGRINAFQALSYSLDNPEFNKNENTLIVYPNPSKGSFNVQAKSYPCTAKVYNTLGQKILEQEITTINTTINIISPGTYIVSIKNKRGIAVKKIIID